MNYEKVEWMRLCVCFSVLHGMRCKRFDRSNANDEREKMHNADLNTPNENAI